MLKDVHTEHCCVLNGCKYDKEDCTVRTGQKTQSFPCEVCSETEEQVKDLQDLVRGYFVMEKGTLVKRSFRITCTPGD